MFKATEESIQGGAGNLFVRVWRPSAEPHAVVAICHGFNSHSGMYAWCGEQFVQKGMAAYALDLRGRGKSDGERFYVERFEDYVDDLDRLIKLAKSREPGLPVILLGHSAGGVAACLYALEHQSVHGRRESRHHLSAPVQWSRDPVPANFGHSPGGVRSSEADTSLCTTL